MRPAPACCGTQLRISEFGASILLLYIGVAYTLLRGALFAAIKAKYPEFHSFSWDFILEPARLPRPQN